MTSQGGNRKKGMRGEIAREREKRGRKDSVEAKLRCVGRKRPALMIGGRRESAGETEEVPMTTVRRVCRARARVA